MIWVSTAIPKTVSFICLSPLSVLMIKNDQETSVDRTGEFVWHANVNEIHELYDRHQKVSPNLNPH